MRKKLMIIIMNGNVTINIDVILSQSLLANIIYDGDRIKMTIELTLPIAVIWLSIYFIVWFILL